MAKKVLTSFGVELRKHRIERSETLYEMAEAVGISPSFLETNGAGNRPGDTHPFNRKRERSKTGGGDVCPPIR